MKHGRPLPLKRQTLTADNLAFGGGATESQSQGPSGIAADPTATSGSDDRDYGWRLVPAGLILTAAFVWAYWPTLVNLVAAWNREPDYSHGFLVAPAAIYFLWVRRDRFPGMSAGLSWLGLGLIVLSLCARVLSAHYYLEAIDGWSIMLWVGGVVWLFAGWRVMWWSLPSIIFLWFMVPLPFRVERWLSLPLQGAATKLSCWALQFLGQPALAEAHVIVLGSNRLEVEQACSGLRIFVGILALAFVYVIVVRRTWWEKGLLLASAIPIALIANASRIVATGMLYQYVSGEAGKEFAHDAAGWVMILFAAGLFGIVLWYSSVLVREVELVEVGAVVRRERG
jgi:exosortase